MGVILGRGGLGPALDFEKLKMVKGKQKKLVPLEDLLFADISLGFV